jgi:hypothetical protein
MLAAVCSALGGEFAKQWATPIPTPASGFWAGGLAAIWLWSHGARVRRHG